MVELDTDLIASADCLLTIEFQMRADLGDELGRVAERHFPRSEYMVHEDVERGAIGDVAEEVGIGVELNEYVIGLDNNRVEVSRIKDLMIEYLQVREEWEIDNLLGNVPGMDVDDAREYVDSLTEEMMSVARLKTTKPMDLALEVDSEIYLEVSFSDRARESVVNEVISEEFQGDLIKTYPMDKRTLLIWKSDFDNVATVLRVRDALERAERLNVIDASVVCNVHNNEIRGEGD